MALSVDWESGVISVPKADMVQVQPPPNEIRQLDIDAFRLELRELEATFDGMAWTKTHDHVTTFDLGDGTILARAVKILDPYTITFEDGQYRVRLVGANSNIATFSNVNQVSIASQNSAGLTDTTSLRSAAYGGFVAVDVNSSFSGTDYPLGLREFAVNNITDAKAIAEANSLSGFLILSSMTLAATDDLSEYTFRGDNPVTVRLTIDDPGPNVTSCVFENMEIEGTLDGGNTIRECDILTLSYVNGFIDRCGISGTITLGGGAQATINDSFSAVAGGAAGQTPTINMGGSGNSLAMRDYDGGITLTNQTGMGGSVSIDMNAGRVIVDGTVSMGTITVRGVADVTDNSTGTAVVDDQTLNKDTRTSRKWATNRQEMVDIGGLTYLDTYDDDGTTLVNRQLMTDADDNPVDLPGGNPLKRGANTL